MIHYGSHRPSSLLRSWLQPWSWPQRHWSWLAFPVGVFQMVSKSQWEAKRVKDLHAECKKLEQYQELLWVPKNGSWTTYIPNPQRNAVRCAKRSSIKQQIALNGSGYRYILQFLQQNHYGLWLVLWLSCMKWIAESRRKGLQKKPWQQLRTRPEMDCVTSVGQWLKICP